MLKYLIEEPNFLHLIFRFNILTEIVQATQMDHLVSILKTIFIIQRARKAIYLGDFEIARPETEFLSNKRKYFSLNFRHVLSRLRGYQSQLRTAICQYYFLILWLYFHIRLEFCKG